MHRCGISYIGDRHRSWLASISIFVMVSFTINAFTPFALAQVPLEGQSGVIERSLRPDDNSDIYLASQVAFAELLFAIDQNITKIYGSYEETQDHLLWMYKLFRDSFPMQEQFLEVDRQPQPNQVKLKKIKTNTKKNNASEGKRL